ncbi:uncharacterized protein V6R79_009452 [Siganus canaliculatus]
MSSQEYSTSLPNADVPGRQGRQHRTPRHLEDYILGYNPQKPALSSQPDEREHTEQRGAAASAGSGQADASFHLGINSVSHSSCTGDPLSTTALRQLIDSMNRSEREERAEIVQLTDKPHKAANVIVTSEGEATGRDYAATLRCEQSKSAFRPIQSASPNQLSSSYSNISSGMVTPTSPPQHPTKITVTVTGNKTIFQW